MVHLSQICCPWYDASGCCKSTSLCHSMLRWVRAKSLRADIGINMLIMSAGAGMAVALRRCMADPQYTKLASPHRIYSYSELRPFHTFAIITYTGDNDTQTELHLRPHPRSAHTHMVDIPSSSQLRSPPSYISADSPFGEQHDHCYYY